MSPFTRAGFASSTESVAWMFPVTSPWMTIEPQLISAVTFAVSPTMRLPLVLISPVKVPSRRTCPSKLSLPSTTSPGPKSAFTAGSVPACRP